MPTKEETFNSIDQKLKDQGITGAEIQAATKELTKSLGDEAKNYTIEELLLAAGQKVLAERTQQDK